MNERLSWSEAEAVVRAYRVENGMSSDVDVATLATTLGTTPDEVRRLAGRRRFTDRSGVLSAVLSAAVIIAVAIAFRPSLLARGPVTAMATSRLHAAPALRMARVIVVSDGDGRLHAFDSDGEPSPTQSWSYPSGERATLLLPDKPTL